MASTSSSVGLGQGHTCCFRKECHRCHLARGEAFKTKSESRELPTKSTTESARVAAMEKELAQLRQAVKKPEEQSQQESDAPAKVAYKHAIQGLGKLRMAGLFSEDHPAIKTTGPDESCE